VNCTGPLDTVVSNVLAGHVLAVVREAVSNAARHARATTLRVQVALVDDDVVVEAQDNGVGIGSTVRSSGLTNLRERAESLGGTFAVTGPDSGGTHLRWTAPI